MTLDPKDRPDWAAAGWDWTGGDDDRVLVYRPATGGKYKLVSIAELEAVQASLVRAHKLLEEKPELKAPDLAPLLETVDELLDEKKKAGGLWIPTKPEDKGKSLAQTILEKSLPAGFKVWPVDEFPPPIHPMCKSVIAPPTGLQAELFLLREKVARLKVDFWLNLFRAFTAGAIAAYIVRDLWERFG